MIEVLPYLEYRIYVSRTPEIKVQSPIATVIVTRFLDKRYHTPTPTSTQRMQQDLNNDEQWKRGGGRGRPTVACTGAGPATGGGWAAG